MSRQTTSTPPAAETGTSHVHYPLPWTVGLGLIWSALLGKQRSFASDARLSVSLLRPALLVYGSGNIPGQGPCLVTINHYSHPGFRSWWLTLAVSACLPFELHWVITDAWRFEGFPIARQFESLSRYLFRRMAWVYGFTSMPSMPPRHSETRARAQAVRGLLSYARRHPSPAIGLAPEGYDMSSGVLGTPPAGVGRLVSHLLPYTRCILPVAIYEEQGTLCLNFGEPYTPRIAAQSDPEIIDQVYSKAVMSPIAQLLPSHLRGEYS